MCTNVCSVIRAESSTSRMTSSGVKLQVYIIYSPAYRRRLISISILGLACSTQLLSHQKKPYIASGKRLSSKSPYFCCLFFSWTAVHNCSLIKQAKCCLWYILTIVVGLFLCYSSFRWPAVQANSWMDNVGPFDGGDRDEHNSLGLLMACDTFVLKEHFHSSIQGHSTECTWE